MKEKDNQNFRHIGKKLRTIRQQQGLSLRELAARADVSPSLLSKIENEKANPSVGSLHSIADALSLPITHFFPEEESVEQHIKPIAEATAKVVTKNGPQVQDPQLSPMEAVTLLSQADLKFSDIPDHPHGPVVRSNARPTIQLRNGVTWSRLTPGPEEGVELMEICYEVGATSGDGLSHHSGREVQLVLEGELLLELDLERYLLKAGDSIAYDSTIPHRLVNVGQVPMRAISLLFNTK
ncbi:MAG: helix-turn-helix domain-containing protein [Anaerolineae bacterium]|nr:helix-turn-helix domain-containing protein [Anaerolineae bacterium]